jgi:arylsulfatase A-like enzyme
VVTPSITRAAIPVALGPRRLRPTVPTAPGADEAFGRWNNVAAGTILALAVVMRLAAGDLVPVLGGVPPVPPVVATTDRPVPAEPGAAAAARSDEPHTRVIIVSEDGMRRDVLNDRYAPRHTALMREGIVARRALTIRQSETLPSHASMLSGVGPEVHGMRWNTFREERGYIDVPTVFSVARAHGLSTAMIIGKKKLEHLAKPGTVDHYERPSHYCKKVSARAAEYFVQNQPDIMFVHFSDPDDAGHSKGWMTPAYLQAVRNSDKCLEHLLAAIDAAGLRDSTMIIVTADHGGHARTHSNGHKHREVDQVIPWIVRGPGIPAGGVLDDEVDTIDTAVTALSALRLPAQGMAGVSHLPALLGASAPTAFH